MAEYTRPPGPVRLSVVAALVGSGATTAHATADECRLAEALHGTPGGPGGAPEPDPPAIAELLRLADGTPSSGSFAVGLLQTFLIPDDSWHPPPPQAPPPPFAPLYPPPPPPA